MEGQLWGSDVLAEDRPGAVSYPWRARNTA